jgi:uncharacterized protein (TIGR02284 family)
MMDNRDTLVALNTLIETCKDGEYGFRQCAEHVEAHELRQLLARRADDCQGAAATLQAEVQRLGGSPEAGGSASGALHRGWVAVRALLSTYDDVALLEECERGEDAALARYRAVLRQPLPESVRMLVEHQCDGVQRNHDQVRALRDALRVR